MSLDHENYNFTSGFTAYENIQQKKLLLQIDSLKEFNIPQKHLKAKAYSILGKKIAHNSNRHLWINKNDY